MTSLPTRQAKIVRGLFFFGGIPILVACLTFIYLHTFIRVRFDPTSTVTVPVLAEIPVKEAGGVVVSPPARLVIPSINLDTTINPTGLTADGDMAIDDSIDDVAWYELGYKPGEKGSAVIAGHYGWKNGVASIFNELHTLQTGDEITSYDQVGNAQTFTVREIRKYDPAADATAVFHSTDGKAHLNLVTCGGTWVNAADTYSDRLVVFTDFK